MLSDFEFGGDRVEFLRRTWKEIDLDALCNNYDILHRQVGCDICAVVKANAYGHGAVTVANALEKRGAASFAVSNIQEAEELHEAGITAPIIILGYTPVECAKALAEKSFIQCVYSRDYAEALSQSAAAEAVTVNAHIKLDTGMCRIGFDCRDDGFSGLDEVRAVLTLPALSCCGVFTHFSSADGSEPQDIAFTKEQYDRFNKAVKQLESEGFEPHTRHLCNSAAALLDVFDKGDMVREGIMLYGLAPSPAVPLLDGMKPVMSLYSVVSMVKEIDAGSAVSYGRTYTAGERIRVATVSAGYADGVPRLLSNRGSVLICGKWAPIIGTICMDQFCVDVSGIDDVKIGDKVTIFGEGLSVDEVAANAETINYEIVCGITKRVNTVIR